MPTPDFVLDLRRHIGTAPLSLVGVTAVILRGDDVLLGRRSDTGALTPITGIVDPGEEPADAARREALEEAGVDVMLGEIVQVTTNLHEPSRPTVGVWFAATLVDATSEPVAGSDAVAVAWFDPAEPPDLAFPADSVLFDRLARGR